MSTLSRIVDQEAAKLAKLSKQEEALSADDLAKLEVLARCSKLLLPTQGNGDDDDDGDEQESDEELRRRARGG
jgi:hypothetical protein